MIDTKALRNKILDLAISGKLTEQLPEDGNAEDLYAHIQEEKARLIAEGKIKKEKPLPPITEEEIPFEIPENWKWVRLADVFIINPKVEGGPEEEAAFIPMEKIEPGYVNSYKYDIQNWETASKNHTKFENDDIAFAKISPCFENRKSFVAADLPNGKGGGTTELIILRQKYIDSQYAFLIVLDDRFIKTGSSTYKGVVGQQRVKTDIINSYCLPLPPFEEQKRIVSAVEDAFAVIDRIEKAQESYFTNQEVLKNKIVDAGIRGKLTEQLPEDGNAEDLYAHIQEEKARLIAEGKIKKEKPLPPVTEEEIPFEIPENWKWVRFGESIILNCGFAFKSAEYKPNGYRVLRISDFNDKGIINTNIVRYGYNPSLSQYLLGEGDILMCMTGGTVGKNCIVPRLTEPIYVNQRVADIKPIICSAYYLYTFVNSTYVQNIISKEKNSTNDNISSKLINSFVLPLPPLVEQNRIADKIKKVISFMQ